MRGGAADGGLGMTERLSAIRSAAARAHGAGDAAALRLQASSLVDALRRALDDREPPPTLRAACQLARDLDLVLDELGEPHGELVETAAELDSAIRMIERNPAESLEERPVTRRILLALLDLAGTPSTTDEIAARSGLTPKAVRDAMAAIHGHGRTVLDLSTGERRYSLSMKGTTPGLLAISASNRERP